MSVKELTNITLNIEGDNLFYSKRWRPFEKVYLYFLGELIWYLSGKNDIKYISQYSIFWKKLVDKRGKINSNYGRLVFYKKNKYRISQFKWCVDQLNKDLNSRQTVILYNDKDYYHNHNKDFICTQLQQFIVRNNKLSSIIYIRSSDIILGLTYDIPFWSFVQQQLLNKINERYKNIQLGSLTIHFGSCHFYMNKMRLIQSILKDGIRSSQLVFHHYVPLYRNIDWYRNNIGRYIDIVPTEFNLDKIYNQIYNDL